MSTPQAYLKWALEKEPGKEHVSFGNFVRHFNLVDRQSASDAFTLLIQSVKINQERQQKLKEAYKRFCDHHAERFWAERSLQVSSEVSAKQAGELSQKVNGERQVTFPTPLPSMSSSHCLLFNHAASCLREYQDQDAKCKDITLLKDAQVSMSCVVNTMSQRVIDYFEEMSEEDLIGNATDLCTISKFDEHPCLQHLAKYAETLCDVGVHQLRKKLIVDWGVLHSKHKEDHLSGDAKVEDKVLQILISLGEKMLDASKIMRKWQAEEYGDVSEAGRKVDCLLMYEGIELSNLEIKHSDISKTDLAIQNKKNIRLARCIQESHVALGVENASVYMVDVCVQEMDT
ncbi:hypothetical protein BGW41_003807 [Actinomortierella wolfii]|nr:hypothetical protein BGW41_003807 [Actinomortierella wolfii]